MKRFLRIAICSLAVVASAVCDSPSRINDNIEGLLKWPKESAATPHALLSVTFLPSFHPECRIEVVLFKGSGQARYSELSRPVQSAIDGQPASVVTNVIRDTRTRRTDSKLSTRETLALLSDFFRQLSTSAAALERAQADSEQTVNLDGTRYLFRFSKGDTEVVLAFTDDEAGATSSGELPLATWANRLRQQFQKALK